MPASPLRRSPRRRMIERHGSPVQHQAARGAIETGAPDCQLYLTHTGAACWAVALQPVMSIHGDIRIFPN
jgi:hypothetical protein